MTTTVKTWASNHLMVRGMIHTTGRRGRELWAAPVPGVARRDGRWPRPRVRSDCVVVGTGRVKYVPACLCAVCRDDHVSDCK